MEQRETLNFADFAGNGNTFALEVRGNSMIDDHICDGDLILLERVDAGARRRYRGRAGARQRNHAEAFLSRAGRHGAAAAGQRDTATDRGSCQGCADTGPITGRADENTDRRRTCADRAASCCFGAEPVFFGGTALATAGFPVGVGERGDLHRDRRAAGVGGRASAVPGAGTTALPFQQGLESYAWWWWVCAAPGTAAAPRRTQPGFSEARFLAMLVSVLSANRIVSLYFT